MSLKIQKHLSSLQADVIGVIEEGIACFRGLPYATVEKRWTHSHTNHSLESPFDATVYGPRCSQGEGLVLVTGGVNDPVPGDDEFKCLNLNVAVPQEALKAGSALPVMVWIHGGAFNYGANSVGRYRPVQLSLLAKAQGNPIILVQIQYRLGPLGFATPQDLLSEYAEQKKDDVNSTFGNFGLVDQIHALEWVRDHISDFGGDPTNVTAFGVSAGSASIHYHILTGNPLFDRAILMSGSAPTLGPLPVTMYQQAWQNFMVRNGGFEGLTIAERGEKARALSPKDVISNYTSAPMGPMADGVLLPSSWPYKERQTPTRCKSIIIGDTKVEAIIMDGLIKSIPPSKLTALAHQSIENDAEGFLNAFGITPDMDPKAYQDAMRVFLSVGMFQYPNILVASTFPGDVFFYHFDEPSPYPGPTFGLPYHGQCALFAYQNGVAEYPDAARNTAESMGRIWTAFANGNKPWEMYGDARRFMRLGPGGKNSMQSLESDEIREYKWMPWVKENYGSLKQLTRDLTVRV